MQVILTHEQADFDALASALGAYLLHPEAKPLQPNQLNRNVRAFIHFYDSELPFVPTDDLPEEDITDLILVDTQSLITIKGINKNTKIHVIDHHQKKDDLPKNWYFQPVESGACTTYFVEQLQDINGHLNLIHATLLLLGIYEDTGSLTYTNTKPRDVRAAAFLLEHGASLKLASQFLNPPLSPDQRLVLNQLMANLEVLQLEGCNVVISSVDAPQLKDEVSSIAHKLSDLYDPDGLFIFVKTHEGIRLVARSETDQIDVAKIAEKYNGGGHAKAAAALIPIKRGKDIPLAHIVHDFKNELKDFILPAVKVKQIMSKKPLLIQPDTTAKQANELMRRYGYEGYPVVDGNEIKGLLVRRAVDRALSHGLDLPASSLMNAGSFRVQPGDSLATLQRVMADSGWGQVPVVDPHNQQVVGIVTRTDLLKTLSGEKNGGLSLKNLSKEIEQSLPPERISLLKAISRDAQEGNLPIYLVGGFARDLLLNRPSLDLDFVVEGDAIQLGQLLSKRYGGYITSHKKFGTAKWVLSEAVKRSIYSKYSNRSMDPSAFPDSVDIISARTEYYKKPTALPTVKKGSIKLDLHRRDFTINTMAVRLDGPHFGDLYDYWGGYHDLKNKKIRVLHSLSFVDDPTRLLRAVRFEQRFGFSIEERTLQLVKEAKDLLLDVSGDRIRHELDLILQEPRALNMFARIAALDLLPTIHPMFPWDKTIQAHLGTYLSAELPEAWFSPPKADQSQLKTSGAYIILLSGIAEQDLLRIIKRLRFKARLKQYLLLANKLMNSMQDLLDRKPSQISRELRKYPQIVIYCVFIMTENASLRKTLRKFALDWRRVEPLSNGETLKEMGVSPGPIYRDILEFLRDAWLDGEINSAMDERKYLEKLLNR